MVSTVNTMGANSSKTAQQAAVLIEAYGLHIVRAGRNVCEGLDLVLHGGERLALTGPTGSGKSSLLHALLGFVPIAAGRITLLGQVCTREADFADRRGPIGLVFQDPGDQLIGPTVLEDVAFGPRNQGLSRADAQRRAMETLTTLGLGALGDRPVHHLSGGQQRQVCLAGVLAMRPRVLLLDEPTVGLDDASRQHLLDAVLATGLPLIVATHDRVCVERLASREQPLHPATGG